MYPLCYLRRMTVMALLALLLLEQVRPLDDRTKLNRPLFSAFDFVEHNLNAGEHHHGITAWLVAVLPLLILSLALYYALVQVSVVLAWVCNVGVLYLTMGFRQFSHHFTDIHRALSEGDLARARSLLREWRGRPADDLNSGEVARLAIEEALISSYHHVFGVLFWFAILPGPAGALLYRLALTLKGRWGEKTGALHGGFGNFSNQVLGWLDWLPLRLTALGFAVVGNFEDAVYCWRNQAARWRDPELGIVLAAGAGALGVKLGKPLKQGVTPAGASIDDRIEIGLGDEADAGSLSSTVGLAWRALVLWMLLLAMLAVATWS